MAFYPQDCEFQSNRIIILICKNEFEKSNGSQKYIRVKGTLLTKASLLNVEMSFFGYSRIFLGNTKISENSHDVTKTKCLRKIRNFKIPKNSSKSARPV